MLDSKLNSFLGLPELKLTKRIDQFKNTMTLFFEKTSRQEVCPKCATLSSTCYDKREVTIKDTPLRDNV